DVERLREDRPDPALDLAVGLGPVGPGERPAADGPADGAAEGPAAVGRAVVADDPPNDDALASEPAQGPDEEPRGGPALLVGQELGVDEAGGIVDRDVQDVPADALALADPAAGHPVARAA